MQQVVSTHETTDRLTEIEQADLARCETTIQKGLAAFVEVGAALIEIRDRKLYRAQAQTFADYVETRWQISRSRAYQLITAGLLSTQVDIQNERQGRELNRLDPDLRPVAWIVAQQIGDKIAPGQDVPVRAVKAAVSVLDTSKTTRGYVDTGDGEMDALEAAVTQEMHETTRRQQQHITESYERQQGLTDSDKYQGKALVVGTDDRRGFVTLQMPDLCRVVGAGQQVYVIVYVPRIEGEIRP